LAAVITPDEGERDGAAVPHLLEAMARCRPRERQQQPRLRDSGDQPHPSREPDQLPATSQADQRERDLQCDHEPNRERRLVPRLDLLLVQIRPSHLTIVDHHRARLRRYADVRLARNY
jgi:hypothetical protein